MVKKKVSVFLLSCLASCLLTGCAAAPDEETDKMIESDIQSELTEEKENLLSKISMDEQRVRDGELYGWQVEVLRQYDAALEYMYEKYPSHQFEIVDCSPQNVWNDYTIFYCQADGQDDLQEMYITKNDDGSYTCADTYYGHLIRDEYSNLLLDLLKAEAPECIAVDAQITGRLGEEYRESMPAESFLEGLKRGDKVSNFVTIYAVCRTEDEAQKTLSNVKTFIQDEGIYGGYTLYALKQDPGIQDGIDEWINEQGESVYWIKENFQQFG